ncbi:MAG: ABC transporter ATP-binding protein, partial [Clostridia bacterium]|nr:ABC transporter ATP-binding protein [Clostridia bacterium]
MHDYYPLLLGGGIIGFISIILIVAFASIKDKKQSIGFDRHMKDGEIIRRLLRYAKPYVGSFVLVGFIV